MCYLFFLSSSLAVATSEGAISSLSSSLSPQLRVGAAGTRRRIARAATACAREQPPSACGRGRARHGAGAGAPWPLFGV